MPNSPPPLILPLSGVSLADAPLVGGKNASLGELIRNLAQAGVRVPDGFATTTAAFRQFTAQNNLAEFIRESLQNLDPENLPQLAQAGAQIRARILQAPLPAALENAVRERLQNLPAESAFAVRSSATAEDAADSSFAGQQETYLNIRGAENTLAAVRHVFASLYTDRAISYRKLRGYDDHEALAISVGAAKNGPLRRRRRDVHIGHRVRL